MLLGAVGAVGAVGTVGTEAIVPVSLRYRILRRV